MNVVAKLAFGYDPWLSVMTLERCYLPPKYRRVGVPEVVRKPVIDARQKVCGRQQRTPSVSPPQTSTRGKQIAAGLGPARKIVAKPVRQVPKISEGLAIMPAAHCQ
eukprot:scaffold888_cov569-Prasinococcus_capsulatus_cf.AAC.2